MTPAEYTDWTAAVSVYPEGDQELSYLTLGLVGEAGEVAEKVKKHYRDGKPVDRQDIARELGDVLWYLTALARLNGYTLQEVLDMNVAKLESRRSRGVQHGSGDDR